PYRPTFGVGQPPPAAWSKSAPSVQQAQIQLGFMPTPAPRKRGISRRAITSMIILGIASVTFLENARSFLGSPPYMHDGMQGAAPEQITPHYLFRKQVTFPYHQNTAPSLD